VLAADLTTSQQHQWESLRELFTSYAAAQPVRRVAVVGNAPLAPDAERAAAIDASDLVFRMNSLRLDEPGEPPCVGTACHVVLLSRNVSATPWVFRDYRQRAYAILQTGFTAFHSLRDVATHWPSDLGAIPLPNGVVTARLADLLDPDREPAALLPTSGLTALFLAHEMFPAAELVATGFSFLTDRQQDEWTHHAGTSTAVNDKHKLDREGALLESWIADGSVRFFD
jgi:hypothetical protein